MGQARMTPDLCPFGLIHSRCRGEEKMRLSAAQLRAMIQLYSQHIQNQAVQGEGFGVQGGAGAGACVLSQGAPEDGEAVALRSHRFSLLFFVGYQRAGPRKDVAHPAQLLGLLGLCRRRFVTGAVFQNGHRGHHVAGLQPLQDYSLRGPAQLGYLLARHPYHYSGLGNHHQFL